MQVSDRNKIYNEDEIAIRFKHRLVSIHPFSNGNERFFRIVADIVINKYFGLPLFSWGEKSENRMVKYLKSLKLADNQDYVELLDFARN